MIADRAIVLFYNVLDTCDEVLGFLEGKTYEDYAIDNLLRAAVEMGLIRMGRDLKTALRFDPKLVLEINNTSRFISKSSFLTYNYNKISNENVWNFSRRYLPSLRSEIESTLADPNRTTK